MTEFFFILRIIIIILLVGLFIGILFLLIKSFYFRPKLRIFQALNFLKAPKVSNEEFIREKWGKLLGKIKSGDEQTLRLAIIEADNLVDAILIKRGYQGESMGKRLKSINFDETNLNDLWRAHKIRNRIAHESEFHITEIESRKIIGIYHKALKDLMA